MRQQCKVRNEPEMIGFLPAESSASETEYSELVEVSDAYA